MICKEVMSMEGFFNKRKIKKEEKKIKRKQYKKAILELIYESNLTDKTNIDTLKKLLDKYKDEKKGTTFDNIYRINGNDPINLINYIQMYPGKAKEGLLKEIRNAVVTKALTKKVTESKSTNYEKYIIQFIYENDLKDEKNIGILKALLDSYAAENEGSDFDNIYQFNQQNPINLINYIQMYPGKAKEGLLKKIKNANEINDYTKEKVKTIVNNTANIKISETKVEREEWDSPTDFMKTILGDLKREEDKIARFALDKMLEYLKKTNDANFKYSQGDSEIISLLARENIIDISNTNDWIAKTQEPRKAWRENQAEKRNEVTWPVKDKNELEKLKNWLLQNLDPRFPCYYKELPQTIKRLDIEEKFFFSPMLLPKWHVFKTWQHVGSNKYLRIKTGADVKNFFQLLVDTTMSQLNL